jgi:hypothetical protein
VRQDGIFELDVAELEVKGSLLPFREERLTLFNAELFDTAERVTELLLAIFVDIAELLIS